MALIEIDATWEEAEKESEFNLIESDAVKLQVSSWEFGASKSGAPMITWTLSVIEQPDFNGREMLMWTPTTGKGRNFLTRFAQACRKPWSGRQIDPDSYIGCIVVGHISIEALDDGRKVNRLNSVTAV